MESLITGIIIAGISGITFIAYKHPKTYEQYFKKLSFAINFIFIILSIWRSAVTTTFARLSSFFEIGSYSDASEAIAPLEIMPFHYLFIGFILIQAYMFFLLNLHKLFIPEDK